jgi:hypothetical protein
MMPGKLDAAGLGPSIRHVPLSSPTAYFWYDAGVLNLLKAASQRLLLSLRLAQKLCSTKVDIYICSEPDSWVIALVMKRLFGSAVVVDLRELYDDRSLAFPSWTQGFVRRTIRRLMRWMGKYTDKIVHVSEERQSCQ